MHLYRTDLFWDERSIILKAIMVTPNINNKIQQGGEYINKRHYSLLKECYDKLELFLVEDENIKYPRKLKTLYDIIFYKNFYGMTKRKKKKLLDLIKINNYDVCFLSSSLGGSIVYDIKKIFTDIKVVVFFHNVEYNFYLQLAEQTGFYKKILAFNAKKNEEMAVKYADKIISLNKRDAIEIKKLYNRDVDFILPTTFEDKYKEGINFNCNKKNNEKKILLFVGSDFYANFHGVNWFIKNVLDNLNNVTLYVVGKGTETWKEKFENVNNLNIVGSVDDLGKYYALADAVVLPIFLGSGMKTKTAEALMYGKYIFGTKEAFEGYDVDFSKTGGVCQSKDDFIEKINNHFKVVSNSYNDYNRKVFLEKYDTNKWTMIIRDFLNKI